MSLLWLKRGWLTPGSQTIRTLERFGASDAWDFVDNSYLRAGRVTTDPGLSVTRASVGTAETADGRIVTFGAGELRRTDKGILVEGARTNLFLNNLVGTTQSITVTAVAHTLSFYGTGTITLSGVSTAGPLVGTGAGQRVTLTFTPTAGSLTLTVTGTVEYAQLEVGAFASSWIPTEGTSVARAADVVTANYTQNYPVSLFSEFTRAVDTGGSEMVLQLDNGGSSNRIRTFVSNTDTYLAVMISGGANTAVGTPSGAVSVGSVTKTAVRAEVDNFRAAKDGALSTLTTSCAVPASAPTTLRFGADTGAVYSVGYFRRVALFPFGLLDAQLEAIMT